MLNPSAVANAYPMTLWPQPILRAGVLAAFCVLGGACSRAPEFDLVIQGGTMYDGTGESAGVRQVDIGIKGDRVTAIGNLTGRRAAEVIDARGKVVAPGFI